MNVPDLERLADLHLQVPQVPAERAGLRVLEMLGPEEPLCATPSEEKRGRKKRREKNRLPPVEERPWLLIEEVAIQVGCCKSMVHRLRRGEIPGIPPLPAMRVGKRKWIVLKESLARWQTENERRQTGAEQSVTM